MSTWTPTRIERDAEPGDEMRLYVERVADGWIGIAERSFDMRDALDEGAPRPLRVASAPRETLEQAQSWCEETLALGVGVWRMQRGTK